MRTIQDYVVGYELLKPYLLDAENFNTVGCNELIRIRCACCNKIDNMTKKAAVQAIFRNNDNKIYCTPECGRQSLKTGKYYDCAQCNSKVYKIPRDVKRSKSGRAFCNSSCSAKYTNTHKTHGIRRSKLEKFLEVNLKHMFPTLNIKFNAIDDIQLELDISIPQLKLAFEINGIYHYKPIWGDEKFKRRIEIDTLKITRCKDMGIDLIIFDVSKQSTYKIEQSNDWLNIIIKEIGEREWI